MDQIKVELQEWLGSDRSIAESAWTSSSDYQKKKQRTDEDVKRVINMLADSKHSVPFESVVLRFWIKLPIAADRHMMTHRISSQSGMSARYRTMPHEYLEFANDVEEITSKFTSYWGYYNTTQYEFMQEYYNVCESANNSYRTALDNAKKAEKEGKITNSEYKRIREFMRGMLPQHNMTERVIVINLRSFSNFIKLRDSEHAQPEIRYVAQLMLKAVETANVCPEAIAALKRNNWVI